MISDQPVRESIKRELERSVVVEASAGTGKTTLLTDRVCAIAQSGVPLEEMAVVTFTEAAASELRIRIRQSLPPELRNRMDQAWISTIHGFAARILREYYHLCGGVPEFTIEATHFSTAEMEMQWDLFLAEGASEEALTRSADALKYPGTGTLLKIAALLEKLRWFTDASSLGNAEEASAVLADKWTVELGNAADLCTDRSDPIFCDIEKAVSDLRNGRFDVKINLTRGSDKKWEGGKATRDHVKQVIKDFRDDLKLIHGFEAILPLQPALEELVIPFLGILRRKWDSDPSRLSFDDLLYRARTAVENSEELRRELGSKFRYIFIDEFQDTSLNQVQLFRLILGKAGLNNKLTVVGDPKQSIYGWRSADIETYKDTVESLMGVNALCETITVNFRSARSIIRFVNGLGENLFKDPPGGEVPFSSRYSPIEPAPRASEGSGVRVFRLPKMASSEEMAVLEAMKIADLITDPGSTAVLMRTKTRLDALLKEFDSRNIPYMVQASRDFHRRSEVRDVAVLLRSLLYPGDRSSEAKALRSIFFAVDDRAITEWKQSGVPGAETERALGLVESLRNTVRTLPPGLFVRTLFRNTCLLQTIKASEYQTGRRLANMRFILELAQSTDDYSDLLETLEGAAPLSADEPSAPPENTTEAVTVSTIHSAKGLAWKHVIITNPGGVSSRQKEPVIEDQRTGQAGLKVKDGFTADYPFLEERENNRGRAEYKRLLYVAVTRPEDRLDIFLPAETGAASPAGVFSSSLPERSLYTEILLEPSETAGTGTTWPKMPDKTPGEPFTAICDPSLSGETDLRDRAMRLGTEVHRIMEHIDFNDPSGWLNSRNALFCNTLEFPEEVMDLVKRFFASFSMENAVIMGREYPLLARGKQYYIDLLLERNGILEAVDYKTDAEDPTERAGFYAEHQHLYRRVLEQATGKKVITRLVFLRHGAVVDI